MKEITIEVSALTYRNYGKNRLDKRIDSDWYLLPTVRIRNTRQYVAFDVMFLCLKLTLSISK